MPQISLIAAMAKNFVIGKENTMPWHLPEDLKHFKKVTLGKPVVMGRKTFESIGKALPGRRNLVISRQNTLQLEGAEVFSSLDAALSEASDNEEIMVIGGAEIYQQALALATKLYLTYIDLDVEGDAFFPKFDEAEWQVLTEDTHQAENGLSYKFLSLEKRT